MTKLLTTVPIAVCYQDFAGRYSRRQWPRQMLCVRSGARHFNGRMVLGTQAPLGIPTYRDTGKPRHTDNPKP